MKRGELLFVMILLCARVYAREYVFSEDFKSYNLGNDTILPVWVPQYPGLASIVQEGSNKLLEVNCFSPYQGDRDIHVALNNSNFSDTFFDNSIVSWEFRVSSCNSTWYSRYGIRPQGANVYLLYSDENNFISVEYKVNGTANSCGTGEARIAAFQRLNGVTNAITPYRTYQFNMNQSYYPSVRLINNLNNSNIFIYLDGSLIVSSIFNNSLTKPGEFLLECAGTNTRFDNVYVNYSKNVICSQNWSEIIEVCGIDDKQLHWFKDLNSCNNAWNMPVNFTSDCVYNQTNSGNNQTNSNNGQQPSRESGDSASGGLELNNSGVENSPPVNNSIGGSNISNLINETKDKINKSLENSGTFKRIKAITGDVISGDYTVPVVSGVLFLVVVLWCWFVYKFLYR